MSQSFTEEFGERKKQVRHYLAVVMKAEREAGLGAPRVVEGRLVVLRAGTFLVLYNLIEASTRASIEAIHDKIITNNVRFEDLTVTLRKEVVRLFKRTANPAEDHTFEDFPAGFVSVALYQNDGFKLSGSVDAKTIRELGACYGFRCTTRSAGTRNGADLLTVKRNRNDLAHGLKTYAEVGREFPARELLLIARRSMAFMTDIVSNVASYLDSEDYLEKVAAE